MIYYIENYRSLAVVVYGFPTESIARDLIIEHAIESQT
jgi:hypothetical protein